MGNLFKFGWPSREHVGEDVLLSMLDGELSSMQARRAHKHLERCWTCRARRDQLEKTIGRFVGYRQHLVASYMPPPPRGREMFLAKLDEMIQARKQPWWSRPAQTLRQLAPQTMSPIIASTLVIGVATVLLLFIWQRSLPPVSAQQLLNKAQLWDVQPSSATSSVVVYQKVEIRKKGQRLERAIYRDVAGKRKLRAVTLNRADDALKQQVESAGVNWQEPLSATSFREWHDHQPAPADKVMRSGDFLLTLTTFVPTGPVESETLTVRANDFHPVGRTIEMRDDDRIEIAELNYAVLPWSGVNDALFEPVQATATELHPALRLPALPTETELDSAELSARLVLNKLRADEGEQITITRTDRVVEVKGVVDTDQRKQEIVKSLWPLPHVKAEVLSQAELEELPRNDQSPQQVTMRSVDVQESPLQKYLDQQGGSKTDLSESSSQLLDAALKVRQNADELLALKARFSTSAEFEAAGSALTQLLASYSGRLQAGLDAEISTLNALGFAQNHLQPFNSTAIDLSKNDLSRETEQNEALCRELIAGTNGTGRPAQQIVSDIYQSAARVRAALALSRSPEQQH